MYIDQDLTAGYPNGSDFKKRLIIARTEADLMATDLTNLLNSIEGLRNRLAITRQAWKDENARVFDNSHPGLERQQFMEKKTKKLAELNEHGKSQKAQVDILEKQCDNLIGRLELLFTMMPDRSMNFQQN